MKILLTGGTGFIGSHVARVLVERGHAVTALVREGASTHRVKALLPHLEVRQDDVLQADWNSIVHAVRPEICLHAAWCMEGGQTFTTQRNFDFVQASLRLAAALEKHDCRKLVVTGTCFEYDTSPGILKEDSLARPATLYGASKLALFLMLERLCAQPEIKLKLAWPRLFYLYGPGEDEKRLVAHVITSLLRGQAAKVTGGEQVRDYMHVGDAARALVELAEGDHAGAMNVASGEPVTLRTLLSTIGELLQKTELIKFGALPYRPDEPKKIVADIRRLQQMLPWRPTFNLHSGLEQTVNWYRGEFTT